MSVRVLLDRDHPLQVGEGRLYLKVINADEIEVTSGRYDSQVSPAIARAVTWPWSPPVSTTSSVWGVEQSFPWGKRLYEVKLRFFRQPDGTFQVGRHDEPRHPNNFFGYRYLQTTDWRLHVPILARSVRREIQRDTGWLEDAITKELNLHLHFSSHWWDDEVHAAEAERLQASMALRKEAFERAAATVTSAVAARDRAIAQAERAVERSGVVAAADEYVDALRRLVDHDASRAEKTSQA